MGYAVHIVNIGSDEVYLEGERVVIHAAEPMQWPIREFCKVPIFFQERQYYLRSKRQDVPARRMVYELWPWPADLHEASHRAVVYDEFYVTERDAAAGTSRRHGRLYVALLPFYPLLGLFWSGFKQRVLGQVGFEPGSITRVSIALTFNLFIAQGIFVGWLGGGLLTCFLGWAALRPIDWALMLILGADSAMRFGQSLKLDVEHQWGFCEWLLPRRR